MGCGCAKVAKNQKELLDDIKAERTKNDEEIKKLNAEIEKANTAGATANANPTANPSANPNPTPGTNPQPTPGTNPQPNPTPSTNVDEQKKQLEGRNSFANGLNQIEEELKKNEYNDLGTLTDLVTKYFTLATSKTWADVQKTVDEIKAFCSKNIKPKQGKTQQEISNLVEVGVNKADTFTKDNKLNLEDPANAYVKEYTAAFAFSREELKKGEYNNLDALHGHIENLNKAWDAKNVEDVKKLHEGLKTYFKDNLKPK